MSLTLSLILALATPGSAEPVALTCVGKNSEGEARTLEISFVRHGKIFDRIAVTQAPNGMTGRWKGRARDGVVTLSQRDRFPTGEVYGTTEMTLKPVEDGRYALSWTSISGSGCIYFGDDGEAECTAGAPAEAVLTS
jgi:hypothetical protein